MAHAVIDVPEIHCEGCVNGISVALNKLSGVRQFDVDLAARQVSVDFDESAVSRSRIEEQIEDAGFDVKR